MATTFIAIIAPILLLVVLFATRKKESIREVRDLPTPSIAVRALVNERKIIDAIKLYRQESGASLREAKTVIDNVRR
ncbi:MAG: hypothetical protein ABIR62_06545 [Dokdonella sp.]|uniref:hypothetical protein n=1 Tax=Dokdonella sp. TaxID=2291710 RepID=UPI00326586E9